MLNFDLIDDSALLVSELGDLITDVRKLVVEVCLANGYLRSQIRYHLSRLDDVVSEEAHFALPCLTGGFAAKVLRV